MQATYTEILGFVFGGGLLGWATLKINYRKVKVDEWVLLLKEYKDQVEGLKDEVHKLREELQITRDKLENAIAQKTLYEIKLAEEFGVDLNYNSGNTNKE